MLREEPNEPLLCVDRRGAAGGREGIDKIGVAGLVRGAEAADGEDHIGERVGRGLGLGGDEVDFAAAEAGAAGEHIFRLLLGEHLLYARRLTLGAPIVAEESIVIIRLFLLLVDESLGGGLGFVGVVSAADVRMLLHDKVADEDAAVRKADARRDGTIEHKCVKSVHQSTLRAERRAA